MTNVKEYTLIFLASFVSITAVMVLLAMIEPRVFSLVTGDAPVDSLQQHADSTRITKTVDDSLHLQKEPVASVKNVLADSSSIKNSTTQTHGENFGTKGVEDSSKIVLQRLTEGVKLSGLPGAGPDTLSDAETKAMAQIFESMDAESATKILANMDDYAFKQVLSAMKKRQSAKILATLEPKHAARILNLKVQP